MANPWMKVGLTFLLWYIGFNVILTVVTMLWPDLNNSSLGFVVTFASASAALNGFIKSHERLPQRHEYWIMVGIGTAVTLILETLRLWLIVSQQPQGEMPMSVILFVLALLLSLTVLGNMFGFSKLFGKRYLEHRQRRQGKTTV